METYCNQRHLAAPPICTIKTKLLQDDQEIFKSIKTLLVNSTEVLSDQSLLSSELYVLTRLIYKMNCQLRREKSLQLLRRVEACLKRYFEIDLLSYLGNIKDILDCCDLEQDEVYLPSRQMMEYVLVRLLGSALLLRQTASFCTTAYVYAKQHLSLGYFISVNLLFVSLVSRVWALCQYTCTQICAWYDELYVCIDKLQSANVQWLPKNLKLPVNAVSVLAKMDETTIGTHDKQNKMLMELDSVISGDTGSQTEAELSSPLRLGAYKKGVAENGRAQEDIDMGVRVKRKKTSNNNDSQTANIGKAETKEKFSVITKSEIKQSSMERLVAIVDHLETTYGLANDDYFKESKRVLLKLQKKSRLKKNIKEKKNWLKAARRNIVSLLTYANVEKSMKIEEKAMLKCLEKGGSHEAHEIKTTHDLKRLKKELKQESRVTLGGKTYIISDPEAQAHITKYLNICQRMLMKQPNDVQKYYNKLLKKIKSMSSSVVRDTDGIGTDALITKERKQGVKVKPADNDVSTDEVKTRKKREKVKVKTGGDRASDKISTKPTEQHGESETGEAGSSVPSGDNIDQQEVENNQVEKFRGDANNPTFHGYMYVQEEDETNATDAEMEEEIKVLKDLESTGHNLTHQSKFKDELDENCDKVPPSGTMSATVNLDSIDTVQTVEDVMENFHECHCIIVEGTAVQISNRNLRFKVAERLTKFCRLLKAADELTCDSVLNRMKISIQKVIQNFQTSASQTKKKSKVTVKKQRKKQKPNTKKGKKKQNNKRKKKAKQTTRT